MTNIDILYLVKVKLKECQKLLNTVNTHIDLASPESISNAIEMVDDDILTIQEALDD